VSQGRTGCHHRGYNHAEAVTIYRTLWNTFVRQTKQHKIFSEETFVQTLYERYYQCLEETKANFESLYQVTKEYRETAVAIFGAQSSIAVGATLALAQVSQRSEEHISQAISLYEEASKSTKATTTTTRSNELKQALSSLYVRQMKSQSSSSFKAEHIERALTMTQEQLNESTSKHGYSHESSLTHVRELATLYQRQQKTDLVVKTLTNAVSQIIQKETSSQKQIESAASIAASFQACQQTTVAHSLVQELHRQICAKDTSYASKWSFDLTKTSRASLAFLASLQYNLRKDLNVTFAEIMASLTMEYIYFAQFRHTLQNNESLTNILLTAAPLRFFLCQNGQDEMITVVENQAIGLFEKRDAQDRETPRIFIVGILDHLGSGRNKDFNRSVILASNDSVAKLTKAKKSPEAYDIANLGFLYASKHDGYNGPRSIGMGFKLASLLVGRDTEKATDSALRKKMLDLSNKIVRKILDICKNLKINFAQIQLYELSHLSVLLGEQHDYETLEVSDILSLTDSNTDEIHSGFSLPCGTPEMLSAPGLQRSFSTLAAASSALATSPVPRLRPSASPKTSHTTCAARMAPGHPSRSRLTSSSHNYTQAWDRHTSRRRRLRRRARWRESTSRRLLACTRTFSALSYMSMALATTRTMNLIPLPICLPRRVSTSRSRRVSPPRRLIQRTSTSLPLRCVICSS
jgi:intracellular sulfur oxidation DsrE/DsrF family protein